MRLFVAINFSGTTKSRLLGLRDELRSASAGGDFSLPESLHLILVFFGECYERQAAVIKGAVNSVDFEPFEIKIDHIGRFKREDGDLWWVGARKSEPLLSLQSGLTEKLIESGFALEKRRYIPSITLGRRIVTDESPKNIEAFGETVNAIELVKPELIGGRLTYTSIQ